MDWPTVILILGALLIIFGAIVAVRIAEAGREAVRDWVHFESRVEEAADKARERHEEEVERMRREYDEAVADMRERHSRWAYGED